MRSTVIVLNGVGSAGKSTIAKELQAIAGEIYLHVAMDAFIDMLPAHSYGQADGFTFETIKTAGHPEVVIHTGPAADRCLRGMRRAVAAMAEQGNNIILDEVLMEGAGAEYSALLSEHAVHWVGVMATLEALEERERHRADRMIGLARWQFDRVHVGLSYDLTVDTTHETPAECARRIKDHFRI